MRFSERAAQAAERQASKRVGQHHGRRIINLFLDASKSPLVLGVSFEIVQVTIDKT